jgi:tetratricopeptide (TPR) repeat protein
MSVTKIERLKRELKRAIAEKDFELALDVVDDMLDIDEDSSSYWNSRGVVLSKMNMIDESIESFDTALELNDEDPKIWFSKGCVLMDTGKLRAALGCLYKSLDLDPAFEKSRERFIRCLDQMVMAKQVVPTEQDAEVFPDSEPPATEIYHDIPQGVVEEGASMRRVSDEDEEELMERAEEIRRKRKIRGTFLDEDMFGENTEEPAGEAEDMEEFEDEETDEEWDEEFWDEEEEEEKVPVKYIRCKCGGSIPIYTEKRPVRFECPECGRTGTLK